MKRESGNVAVFSHLFNAKSEGQYYKFIFQRLVAQDQYLIMKTKSVYKCFQWIELSSANEHPDCLMRQQCRHREVGAVVHREALSKLPG